MKTLLTIILLAVFCVSAFAAKPLPKEPVNINTATNEVLCTLPGIGKKTADNIIEYRTKTPFKTVDELDNVKGIGPKKLAKIKPYAKVIVTLCKGTRVNDERLAVLEVDGLIIGSKETPFGIQYEVELEQGWIGVGDIYLESGAIVRVQESFVRASE
jgi:competence protein ComEA